MSQLFLDKAGVPALTLVVIVFFLLFSRSSASGLSARPISSGASFVNASLAEDPTIIATPTATPTSTPISAPTAVPTPTQTPAPSPVRIVIAAIGVDAPIVEVGVLPDGTVEAPRGPDEVAWTNGSAKPGTGGNAVLSGHLDWSLPAPRGAVFWRLSSLTPGDKADVYLADSSILVYEVISSTRYLASSAPGKLILGPSTSDIITMITCEGTYYREARDYSHRRVVVARLVRS